MLAAKGKKKRSPIRAIPLIFLFNQLYGFLRYNCTVVSRNNDASVSLGFLNVTANCPYTLHESTAITTFICLTTM